MSWVISWLSPERTFVHEVLLLGVKSSNTSNEKTGQTPLEESLKPRYSLRCWESWGVSGVRTQVDMVLEQTAPHCLMCLSDMFRVLGYSGCQHFVTRP